MNDKTTSEKARKVLVVFAHPDDAEFTAGGTLAIWAAKGSEIYYVVCTDGSKGDDYGRFHAEKLTRQRQDEQQNAAKVLGVKGVTFLRHADGELVPDQALKAELAYLIRTSKPDTLLTWDPWRHYQLHSAHRAAGQAAFDAAIVAGSDRYFPEQINDGLRPHRVEEIYLFGTDNPDTWMDISSAFPRKMQAISQHTSQVTSINEIEKEIGNWNRHLGENRGFTYAEAFKVLRPHCEICR